MNCFLYFPDRIQFLCFLQNHISRLTLRFAPGALVLDASSSLHMQKFSFARLNYLFFAGFLPGFCSRP